MDLHKWQEHAIEYFNKNKRCIFEVVTGAGKSFLSIQLIKKQLKQNPNTRVLIVAPKNVILEKTWLPELHNNGFPINNVGLYNMFSKEFSKITLVSIQSLKSLVKNEMYHLFDMVIFDEVHNYGTSNYLKLLQIKKPVMIGLSATVVREDFMHYNIFDCFDNNIFTYKIDEALDDNILNPFEFVNVTIEIKPEYYEEYKELTDEIKRVLRGDTDLNEKRDLYLKKLINKRKQLIYNYPDKFEIVKDIVKKNNGSKILVFNQYNKTSSTLYWKLLSDGIKSGIMNSDISRYQQSKIFKKYEKGDLNILLATTMIDEGYNLPKIDIAIIMAANSTDKQFYQRMGRVLRKKDKHSKVYYLNVEKTFEQENLNKKLDLIKVIALDYSEVYVKC